MCPRDMDSLTTFVLVESQTDGQTEARLNAPSPFYGGSPVCHGISQ